MSGIRAKAGISGLGATVADQIAVIVGKLNHTDPDTAHGADEPLVVFYRRCILRPEDYANLPRHTRLADLFDASNDPHSATMAFDHLLQVENAANEPAKVLKNSDGRVHGGHAACTQTLDLVLVRQRDEEAIQHHVIPQQLARSPGSAPLRRRYHLMVHILRTQLVRCLYAPG
jgi:hypothetical protein